MRITTKVLVCLLACFSFISSVSAQEQRGRILGVVMDTSKGVLPGVSVTATSPALIQPQSVITSDDGSYRFPALPTGIYSLTFELAGFQTVQRRGISVATGAIVTLDVEIGVSTLEETLTVVGRSPMIDSKATGVATSFQGAMLNSIPNARDLFATVAQAPGFQMSGYDVGGSHAASQTGLTTYGFSRQNTTRIEGVNVTETDGATNL